MTPSIGRIVHFNSTTDDGKPTPFAALIIDVHSATCVTLQVCNPGGTWTTQRSIELGTAPGSWAWPART